MGDQVRPSILLTSNDECHVVFNHPTKGKSCQSFYREGFPI